MIKMIGMPESFESEESKIDTGSIYSQERHTSNKSDSRSGIARDSTNLSSWKQEINLFWVSASLVRGSVVVPLGNIVK